MRHPDEAMLRRLLDQPAAVADTDREHLTACPACLGRLAAVRAAAGVPMSSTAPVSETVTTTVDTRTAVGPAAGPATGAVRSVLGRPVAAALAVGLIVAGAGAAAADDWLPVFRTERIAPVGVSAADLVALPDLSGYGDVVVTGDGDVREVPDAAAAAAETGLRVPAVTALPRGVTGEPGHHVSDEIAATFTFSTARATHAAAEAGTTLPPPPPGLDGSPVRLVVGPAAVQTWSSEAGAPSLVLLRAAAPSVSSSTVPFETARDYLLSLPGVPPEVAEQLRAFAADGSTLALPVPTDRVTISPAQVDGAPATVLTTRDRTMAAVVWVDDGVVTAVAGSLDADEVLSVARELR